MKVTRNSTGLFANRSPRGKGCAPLLILLMVATAVVAFGRHWIGQRLSLNRPQRTETSLPAALSAFDSGDLRTAVDYALQVAERSGADADVYELLIRALIYRSYSDIDRESDRERALQFSREAIALFPRNLDLQAIHSYALQANGYADEAGRIALRIVERLPSHVLARIVLALSYGSQGISEAALREAEVGLDTARQQGRYQLESHRAMALAYGDLGKYREAVAQLDHAISLNGKLIPLHFEAAFFAMQISDIDKATVAYYRIMALDEDNVKVRVRLCELSDRLLERDSALRYCREVTELAPAWAEGWYKLGRLLFLGGDYVNAQSAFSHCSRLQVENEVATEDRQLECWYLQGQSAEIRGDCAGLMKVYREFLDMVKESKISQTWSYPPDGPPICARQALSPTQAASP